MSQENLTPVKEWGLLCLHGRNYEPRISVSLNSDALLDGQMSNISLFWVYLPTLPEFFISAFIYHLIRKLFS